MATRFDQDFADNKQRARRTQRPGKPAGASAQGADFAAQQERRRPSPRVRKAQGIADDLPKSMKARTAERAASAAKGSANGVSKLSKAASGTKLGKLAKGGGKKFAPISLGMTAFDTYNTPTSEFSKLTGLEPSDAGSADNSVLEDVGGLAKDFVNRSLGSLYQLGENTMAVPLVDALPGVNLPRFEQGEYVPGDQVDEIGVGDILGGANSLYRDLMGYEDEGQPTTAPADDAAPTIARPARSQRQPANTGQGVAPGAQGRAMAPASGARNDALTSTRQPGDTGNVSVMAGDTAMQRYTRMIDMANNSDRRVEKRRDRATNRRLKRERSQDLDARRDQLRTMRDQAQNLLMSGDEHDELLGLRLLQNLTGAGGRAVNNSMPSSDLQTQSGAQQSVDASQAQMKNLLANQSQSQAEIMQRIAQISQTNPAQAQQMARQYALMTGQAGSGDRYVEGQQVISMTPAGEPLLEPITADVTYDTLTGRQYGGRSASEQPQQQAVPKQQWIALAAADPRNSGLSREDLAAAYDSYYGS